MYTLLKTIPKGKVTTYKALADALGSKAYRAIGQFMKNNPYSFEECHDPAMRIPCHRVVSSDGSIGGFMGRARGATIQRKIDLLAREGIQVTHGKITNFRSVFTVPVINQS